MGSVSRGLLSGAINGAAQGINQSANLWITDEMKKLEETRLREYQKELVGEQRAYEQEQKLADREYSEKQPKSNVGKMISDLKNMGGDDQYQGSMTAAIQAELTGDKPSSIKEWEFYKNDLSKSEQIEFLNLQRAGKVVDLGDKFVAVNPDNTVTDIGEKSLSPDKQTNYLVEAEKAKVQGKSIGENIASAPQEIQQADQMISLIDSAISHPGREAATGMSSVLNPVAAPGSERKDFLVLADQLKGNTFLQAYQGLKGGGQITEVEGKKAQEAQARLNEAQSETEYLNALNEMKFLVEVRKQRSQTLLDQQSESGSMGYQPQAVEPKSPTMRKQAPRSALQALYSNPDKIDDFVAKFGYRPEGF